MKSERGRLANENETCQNLKKHDIFFYLFILKPNPTPTPLSSSLFDFPILTQNPNSPNLKCLPPKQPQTLRPCCRLRITTAPRPAHPSPPPIRPPCRRSLLRLVPQLSRLHPLAAVLLFPSSSAAPPQNARSCFKGFRYNGTPIRN